MSKTQTKTKTKTKIKTKTKAILPAGYRTIERAPNWDHKSNPIIEGRRGETKEVVMDKGKSTQREVRNFVLKENTLGPVVVWESSGLRELFDQTDEGDQIRIEFLGIGDPIRNRDTGDMMEGPKLFACGIKE